jgi:hypothetical protein
MSISKEMEEEYLESQCNNPGFGVCEKAFE